MTYTFHPITYLLTSFSTEKSDMLSSQISSFFLYGFGVQFKKFSLLQVQKGY